MNTYFLSGGFPIWVALIESSICCFGEITFLLLVSHCPGVCSIQSAFWALLFYSCASSEILALWPHFLASVLCKKTTGRFQWKSEAQEVFKELTFHLSMACLVDCQGCTCNKKPRTRPAHHSPPLFILSGTWSYLFLGFVVVGRYSKACKVVALPKF